MALADIHVSRMTALRQKRSYNERRFAVQDFANA